MDYLETSQEISLHHYFGAKVHSTPLSSPHASHRFFMSAQSGLMGVQITEQYELTHASKKDTRSAALSQNESRSGKKVGNGTSSNSEQVAGRDAQHSSPAVYTGSGDAQSRARVRVGLPKEQTEDTESTRGLTSDAIHERREFTLDFADGESRHSSLK